MTTSPVYARKTKRGHEHCFTAKDGVAVVTYAYPNEQDAQAARDEFEQSGIIRPNVPATAGPTLIDALDALVAEQKEKAS